MILWCVNGLSKSVWRAFFVPKISGKSKDQKVDNFHTKGRTPELSNSENGNTIAIVSRKRGIKRFQLLEITINSGALFRECPTNQHKRR
jgi:hypothetical protein